MTQASIPQPRTADAERRQRSSVQGPALGVDWPHRFDPGFPLFVQLTRQGRPILLTGPAGGCDRGGAVCFVVPDVDQIFRVFSERGVGAIAPPMQMSSGARAIVISEPGGNRLRFASASV